MPRRNQVLVNNEVYHVFNRSVAKENIFVSKIHIRKIFEIIDFYRFPQRIRLSKFKTLPKNLQENYLLSYKNECPLVEIYAYAFMPNHYHLLLKQLRENGILKFTSNLQNSFAKYFNIKYNRNGTLLENSFKAKRMETEDQCIHVSRYIHLNPVTSYLIEIKDLINYPWTSFPIYAEKQENRFIYTDFLTSYFNTSENHVKFVEDQANYQRDLALIKDLILD